MPARSPAEVHPLFVAAFNAGDDTALMDLYESEGVLVPEPGQVLSGTAQVRAALQQFLALNGRVDLTPRHIAQAGDVALLIGDWTLNGTGPDGSAVTMHGPSIEVVRRQADGSWRYVIDAPFGQALLG